MAARDEIFTIFPELDEHIAPVAGARIFAPGRKARNLARRHGQAKKALVM
ncbi:hypothetical protein H4P12_14580 [Paracoccus sp. 11-3]|uniref:Uncharacterized protein n=1 Tax=Paracoccus amoyensis TaxID=2760093 RepID=A0A926GIK1_9RHOB|nr:hypothetical protein [Paracoccus amoyensis]MBC9247904.1 hypothetical protein [Paracoccus amoyensis]